MKVSLVTVSFNSVRTIEETLRSVLGQEGVELEYIVVDGASRDGTASIIRKYQSQLAWWVSEPDRGQVDALNKGFARATGDILGFLNADDVLIPGALKAVCERFAAQPEADIVYGGIDWIDFEGNPMGSHLGNISSLDEILDIYAVWWGGRQWVQPEVFYRRALKERVGCFDERYHLAFDYDFWVRCLKAGARVERLTNPLVRFRRHAAQKSTEFERANNEIRTILGRHLAEGVALSPMRRRTLSAQLSYDLYHTSAPETRPSFISALAANPSWLLTPTVRSRLFGSLFNRASRKTRPSVSRYVD